VRIVILQHVAFEGPGAIEPLLRAAGHQLATVRLDLGQPLPELAAFDGLVVMGGPMGVDEVYLYPWLEPEQELLKAAIAAGKQLLGICLGAQLIAVALGAAVTRNRWREIGWFPIERTPEAAATPFGALLPEELEVFHWHGDTFALPDGCIRLASSAACVEQGFVRGDQIVGLQFHLEMTPAAAQGLIRAAQSDLDGSRCVQSATQILVDDGRYARCHAVLTQLLQQLF
jgi:GMP synthase-like glutamine amidotransferase